MSSHPSKKKPSEQRLLSDAQRLALSRALTAPVAPDDNFGYMLSGDGLSSLVDRAESGDIASARAILLIAAYFFDPKHLLAIREDGREIVSAILPPGLFAYLHRAFLCTLRTGDASKALNLKRTSGSAKIVRDDWVKYFYGLATHHGLSHAQACEKAADLLSQANVKGPKSGWSGDVVRKIVQKQGRGLGKKHP